MSWEELLLRRLEGRLNDIKQGANTARAEKALGFDPMVYFYVGRCVPAFGKHAFASRPVACDPRTTPFDTGALVSSERFIVTDPPVTDVPAFVSANSYVGQDYVLPMSSWLQAAYDDPISYVDGMRPTIAAVATVDLDLCPPEADERVWAWETRIPKRDYDPRPLAVEQVFFLEGERELYLDWVEVTELLDEQERDSHIAFIYEHGREVPDVALAMLDYMKKGLG